MIHIHQCMMKLIIAMLLIQKQKLICLIIIFSHIVKLTPQMQNLQIIIDIPPDQTLDSINVTECEIFQLQLQCLDTNKACGHDGLSAKMLKEAGSTIVPSLCKLINTSLAQCKFPVGWKEANIIPVHKKDNKSTVSNYRPISLLNIVCPHALDVTNSKVCLTVETLI